MGPDLSVFDRIKTKQDFDREEEMFNLKRLAVQKAQQGNLPAAIQIANEIEKRRAAGNETGAQLLENTAKIYDKGVQYDPATGQYIDMRGYGGALGNLEYGKNLGGETATQQVRSAYEPARAGAVEQQRLNQQLQYEGPMQQATVQGKRMGEATAELGERTSTYPQLMSTVEQLSKLGKGATYTMTGRIGDAIRNEAVGVTGRGRPSEGSVARTEYISLVSNQILPLLRQTFGAQFTEREGESLKVTLGDPNLPPEQKDAVLRSFIDQKIQTMNSLERELGQPTSSFNVPAIGQPPKLDPRNIPMDAVMELKADPSGAAEFDEIFGEGAARMVLGGE